MFLLAVCLVGTAMALPAIPPAPVLEDAVLIDEPLIIAPMSMPYLRALDAKIEPIEVEAEPKEEPKEEPEMKEPAEESEPVSEAPAKPAVLKPETVFVVPKPIRPILSDWFSFLPSFSIKPSVSLPSLSSLPGFSTISNLFSKPKIIYSGLPGAVLVEEAKL